MINSLLAEYVLPFFISYLMLNHSQFCSSDLNNYKNTKAYIYFKELDLDVIVITESMKVYIGY